MIGLIIFIVGIVILIFALGLLAVFLASPNKDALSFKEALAAICVGIVIILIPLVNWVPSNQVGVTTVFGEPKEIVEPGIHFNAPWTSTDFYDTEVKTNNYTDNTTYQRDLATSNAIEVSIANDFKAHVNASVRWQIKPEVLMDIYNDYPGTREIRWDLVDANFRESLEYSMANYDPLNSDPKNDAATRAQLASDAKDILTDEVGDRVDILSVTISSIDYDKETQMRISELRALKELMDNNLNTTADNG